MGFLDQSTNNIILDAVLTDKGREFLSRNDGSFSIVKFSLSDDEVDYSIIQQYGRTVGKEKIEKNTPIMEALTQGNLGQKYRLKYLSNPYLNVLPSISLTSQTSSLFTLSRGGNNGAPAVQSNIVLEQSLGTGNGTIPNELIDSAFKIEMNNLFLKLSGGVSDSVSSDNIAIYTKVRQATLSGESEGASLLMSISVKSISDSVFNLYKAKGQDYIRTFVTITGINSGAVTQFEVNIK